MEGSPEEIIHPNRMRVFFSRSVEKSVDAIPVAGGQGVAGAAGEHPINIGIVAPMVSSPQGADALDAVNKGIAAGVNKVGVAFGCGDAGEPGHPAELEKTLSALLDYMARADMIIGIGEVDCSQLLVPNQMIVDSEIARRRQRCARGSAPARPSACWRTSPRCGRRAATS